MEKFFQFLEEIQQRPKHIRERILYITTGVLFTLLFFFWLSVFPESLKHESGKQKEAKVTDTPVAILGKLWMDTKNSMGTVKTNLLPATQFIRSGRAPGDEQYVPPRQIPLPENTSTEAVLSGNGE